MLANPIAVIVVYDFDLTHSRVSKVRVGQKKLSYIYFPRLSYVLHCECKEGHYIPHLPCAATAYAHCSDMLILTGRIYFIDRFRYIFNFCSSILVPANLFTLCIFSPSFSELVAAVLPLIDHLSERTPSACYSRFSPSRRFVWRVRIGIEYLNLYVYVSLISL
jgi:hypothetical protein